MPDNNMSIENPLRPRDIGFDTEQGLSTAKIPLPESTFPRDSKINLDFIAPYIVTESCRQFSPFYTTSDSIGLEDKVLDMDFAQDKAEAPEKVADYFAERSQRIFKSMELLHGANYVARAKTLIRSGHFAPATSPQGREDTKIVADLEVAVAALILDLNSKVEPDGQADQLRQQAYSALAGKSQEELEVMYKKGEIIKIDSDLGYVKKNISSILNSMSESKRNSWLVLRDLVKRFSNPQFRTASSKLPATTFL